MKMKSIGFVIMAFIALLITVGAALASTLPTVDYVKINNEEYVGGETLEVERGDALDIKVKLTAPSDADVKDVVVEADILGYEYSDHEDDLSDQTHTFDISMGNTVYKTLTVTVPKKVDKDSYDLRIRVSGRTGYTFERLLHLQIKGVRHDLLIEDVVFSPNKVLAGRLLGASVEIKNVGDREEESVKVIISIPELDLVAQDYIDNIKVDDEVTSEELWMRIPDCAEAGEYDVNIEVKYDNYYESVKTTKTLTVQSDEEVCKGTSSEETTKTTITVGSEAQQMTAGESGAIYPVTITNQGTSSKTYTIEAGSPGWASFRISPSNVLVVGAGESKTAYVYVTANQNAAAGQQMFTVTVSADGEVLKQIPLSANVLPGKVPSTAWTKIKKVLEVGLIVLVILLIILGLIVGFNKLREKDEEEESGEEEEGQTYY